MDDRGGSFVAVRRISHDINRGHSTSSGMLRELVFFLIRNLATLCLSVFIISSFSSTCLSGVVCRSSDLWIEN